MSSRNNFFCFIHVFYNSGNVVYFILQSEKNIKEKRKVEEEESKRGKERGNVGEREHWEGMIELITLKMTI